MGADLYKRHSHALTGVLVETLHLWPPASGYGHALTGVLVETTIHTIMSREIESRPHGRAS